MSHFVAKRATPCTRRLSRCVGGIAQRCREFFCGAGRHAQRNEAPLCRALPRPDHRSEQYMDLESARLCVRFLCRTPSPPPPQRLRLRSRLRLLALVSLPSLIALALVIACTCTCRPHLRLRLHACDCACSCCCSRLLSPAAQRSLRQLSACLL